MTPQELLQEIEVVIATLPEEDRVMWMRFVNSTVLDNYRSITRINCDWWDESAKILWSIYGVRRSRLQVYSEDDTTTNIYGSVEEATKELIHRIQTEWLSSVTGAQCDVLDGPHGR